jgi:hypothetical protein
LLLTRGGVCGIDLERSPAPAELIEAVVQFLSPEERAGLQRPGTDVAEAALQHWVVKEAYLKALGAGLARDLDSFTVRGLGSARITVEDPLAPGQVTVLEASIKLPDEHGKTEIQGRPDGPRTPSGSDMITVPWIARQKTAGTPVTVMASRLDLSSRSSVPLFLYLSLGAFVQVLRTPGVAGAGLKAEPLKGRFWTLSSWTDKDAIGAYSTSEPHRSTVNKLKPRMAGSRFLVYQVTGKPDWKDAIARIKEADAAAEAGAAANRRRPAG